MLRKIGILFFIIFLIGSLFDGCRTTSAAQKKMEEYLTTQYGKEFIVERPKLSSGGFFTVYEDFYISKAHLKELPEVVFEVEFRPLYKAESYDDNFLNSYWSYQGRTELRKRLTELYGKNIELNYVIDNYFESDNLSKKDAMNLDYSEALKAADANSDVDIKYYVTVNGSLDKRGEAENAYKILKEFIFKYELERFSFQVLYIPQKTLKENLKEFGLDDSYDWPEKADAMHSQKKLINYLSVDNAVGSIKGPEDMEILFKY